MPRLTFLLRSGQYRHAPCPIWALKMSSESPQPSRQHPNPTEHSGTARRSPSVAESLTPTGSACTQNAVMVNFRIVPDFRKGSEGVLSLEGDARSQNCWRSSVGRASDL